MTKKKQVCKYCQVYSQSSRRSRELKTTKRKRDKLIRSRYCKIVKKNVEENSKICKKFLVATFFWCLKDNNMLHVSICINRRETMKEGCVRCKQGTEISKMMEVV